MTDMEIEMFIETMADYGDIWEPDEVRSVYANQTLEEALEDRKAAVLTFGNILATVLATVLTA